MKIACKEDHSQWNGWCPCDSKGRWYSYCGAKETPSMKEYERKLNAYNKWIQKNHPEKWAVGMAD